MQVNHRARLGRVFWLAVAVVAIGAPPADARQRPPIQIAYTIEVKDLDAQLFHVTATFSNLKQARLDLALPVWTPGWYTLEYYAKNIRRFTVTDGKGNRLAAPLADSQTWRIDTRNHDTVVVAFDYKATTIYLNQAFVGQDWAFFTGTQLFLEPVGHRGAASTVRFELPAGWRIASALAETSDPAVYTAPTYDVLVDSPTWLGAFQSHRFEFEGKPYFVIFPSNVQVPAEILAKEMAAFGSVVSAQSKMFGGLPYEKYLSFHLPGNTGDALEHMNSTVGLSTEPGESGHEHFHVWNVKRIRPAEMWPYNYAGPNETPSLWVSEGLTTYYAGLLDFRAGRTTQAEYLRSLGNMISFVESNEERQYVSASDASFATWRKYLGEPVNYYATGGVLGALLDLSILHDTNGARGLDDVMRAMFERFYKQNKGFTAQDLEHTVSAVAGRDSGEFFRSFVTGVEVPPYDTLLGYAGLVVTLRKVTEGVLGAQVEQTADGARIIRIAPDLAAAKADLRVGDEIRSADGVLLLGDLKLDRARVLDGWLAPRAGTRVVFAIVRGGAKLDVPVNLGIRRRSVYSLAVDPDATAAQLMVRSAWLGKK